MLRKGVEIMGPRTDFDLLRIVSHQLERLGLGKAFHYKSPAAVFEEIRKTVRRIQRGAGQIAAGRSGANTAELQPKRTRAI